MYLFEEIKLSFLFLFLAEAQGPKKDIIFLVDGSDGVGREFPIIQEFMRKIVESLNVGENKIRIGVVQYGDSPHADIYLNTYTTKEGVLNAISSLQQRRGRQRNLGQALQFVGTDVLTAARGSRKQEGVPQFLIVVSSGSSTDDITRPATSLKRSRVLPFSIGTRDVNPKELQVVSYVPKFVLNVDDIPGLYTAHEDLITILTELSDDDIANMVPVFPTDDGNFTLNLSPLQITDRKTFLKEFLLILSCTCILSFEQSSQQHLQGETKGILYFLLMALQL